SLDGLPGQSSPDQRPHQDTWFNFGPVKPAGGGDTGAWDFHIGFWAAEGLTGTPRADAAAGSRDRKEIHLALETPFARWPVRNAALLPGDKVLFQFGPNQICVLDPATSRVTLLCYGRGPVTVIAPGG